tara:strand:- start:115 stop:216 length:102 start_codon:yes stop_codon:yes gene_type:complete
LLEQQIQVAVVVAVKTVLVAVLLNLLELVGQAS